MTQASGKFRLLDLFSGIGGFSLGLERSGYFRTVAFCEIEPFPRQVLKKHWPDVPIYKDVRTLTADALRQDGIAVDAICGGFPCQDISLAGKGAGLDGERSGLWFEYARIIGEVRPRIVIVENVAALLGRGLDRVLGDLASLGFDAEWHCIPASAIGAPHRRDRLWIVAHTESDLWRAFGNESTDPFDWSGDPVAHAAGFGSRKRKEYSRRSGANDDCSINRKDVAHSVSAGLERRPSVGSYIAEKLAPTKRGSKIPDSDCEPTRRSSISWRECSQWLLEPDVGRVAHGVPSRLDRLKGLGNAVVPQIPELIGRAIGEAMANA